MGRDQYAKRSQEKEEEGETRRENCLLPQAALYISRRHTTQMLGL